VNNNIFNFLEKAKSLIGSLAVDYAEIRLAENISNSILISGENVESVTSGESIGGSIRVLKNGGWGFISFNDFSTLEKNTARCVEIAEMVSGENSRGVVSCRPVRAEYSGSFKKDFREISVEEKFNLISSYNDIIKNSRYIQSTNAAYRDTSTRYLYLNSEGSELTYNKMYCGISLSSIARDGALIQPFSTSVAGNGGYEIVENLQEEAERVIKTAVDMLSAGSVPGGAYDIIVDPKLAGVFIHEAFGHMSEADSIYENPRMKEVMELGKRFGPEELNVVDDGSMEGLSGYIPFDDEGIVPEKTSLIKNGVLAGRLHSRETAYRMKENPSGNGRAIGAMKQPIVRMTNTYIENGGFSRDEIFENLDDGIYALNFIGGQTNLEMFTFTAGYGYEVKNGKPGRMFRDIVLSGNVFQTLKDISMIGNDRKMYGGLGGCGKGGQMPLPVSFGGPHMLIKDVLIGGAQ
jgi:TldD protein